MKDTIVKGISANGHIRLLVCTSTNLVEQARQIHNLWPTSAAALGRTMSIAALMASNLKDSDQKLTVNINGGGPLGSIMVDAWADGRVRGFVGDSQIYMVNNQNQKLAVGQAVGTNGTLRVIRDMGLKSQFTGQVELQSGEIGDDFAYYFTVSEQTPSAVSVGVLVSPDEGATILASGAMILQLMPDATEEDITRCEEIVAGLKPISSYVNDGLTAKELAKLILDDVQILDELGLNWYCNCSKERFATALTTIKRSDIEEIIAEDHGCDCKCEYCQSSYHFTEEELEVIKERAHG